ncbi:MAG TPA: hypothetical protein PLA01_03920 [Acetivibrio sp.]|nr:hypothetical protein [Acetivibrio sp.]
MSIKKKKTVISDDKIIILDYLDYFTEKFLLLILLIVFGPILIQVISTGYLPIILILAAIFILAISFTLYERFKKNKSNIQEGYEYIIDKSSQTLIIKKTEYFKFKKYEYSIKGNVKLKITDNFDNEENKPYYNLYISAGEKEILIQQAYNENFIKELVDEIIRLLNIPHSIIEDPKGILFNESISLPIKGISDYDKTESKEVLEDEIIKNRHPKDSFLNAGEEYDDAIKRKILLEKIDEINEKDKNHSTPLLEGECKAKVYDRKLIINVRRNYILFFAVLALFLFLIYKFSLVETVILERTGSNVINCVIKYNFLGIEKLEAEKYILNDLKNFITKTDSEGDITYTFEYQNNKRFNASLFNANSEDVEAIESFLKDESEKKLIIQGKQHFSSILFNCFLALNALLLIISSIEILLKRKIRKMVIDGDGKKILVTFKSIIKNEEMEYAISILDSIEIKKISDKDYLYLKMLNRSLNVGQIKNKNNLYNIEMFINNLFS